MGGRDYWLVPVAKRQVATRRLGDLGRRLPASRRLLRQGVRKKGDRHREGTPGASPPCSAQS